MFQRKPIHSFSITLILVLIMAACTPVEPIQTETPGQGSGQSPDDTPATAEPDKEPTEIMDDIQLAGTSWDLVSYGPADAQVEPLAGASVTLDFDEEQAGGRAACNFYGGTYEILGHNLAWSGPYFNQTEMACEPDLMQLEMEFLQALAGDKDITLEGDTLTLTGDSGVLVFEKARHAVLEGTDWVLAGLPRQGAVVQTWVDAKINITFKDGTVSGSSGCNSFSGSYELDGNELILGPLAGTLRACEAEIMQRESDFLAGLDKIASYTIHRETLTMLDAEGNMVMTFSFGESAVP